MNAIAIRLAPLIACGLALAAAAADPIGSVIALQGQASAAGADGAARALAMKAAVFTGDTLKTGPGSRVQILFSDDSLFSQGENSETVLDEYVYDPGAKEKNGFKARVGKGVFRTVTGKITELNPSRFQIQTGRSTIGIRGCGVAGQIGPNQDDFAIDFVSPGTEIIIFATQRGPGQPLRFNGPGGGFVDNNGNSGQGPFDPLFFRGLLGGTAPGFNAPGAPGGSGGFGGAPDDGGGGGGGPLGGAPGAHGAGGPNGPGLGFNPLFGDAGQVFLNRRIGAGSLQPGGPSGGSPFTPFGLRTSLGIIPRPGSSPSWDYFGYTSAEMTYTYFSYYPPPGVAGRSERGTITSGSTMTYQDLLGSANGVYDAPASDLSSRNEDHTRVALDKSGVVNPAFLAVDLFTSVDSSTPYTTLGPPDASVRLGGDDFNGAWLGIASGDQGVIQNRGQGSDWVWGEWAATQTTANSETTLSGVYAAGRTLGAADIDALRQGSQVYQLHSDPIGRATAFVGDSSVTRRLDGTADLNVTLGGGTAQWAGSFQLTNTDGDSLSFDVAPTAITPLGHLQGSPSNYSLNFSGGSYGTPANGSMTGNLVGPGQNNLGLAPVTGAIGSGRFDHGTVGPSVELTYGTDLRTRSPSPK
ncbi:MAG: FecR domain-containing protein [Lentisphaerae bacterium]|nr:FecR domain-containing protein [Lentisphaerota bacterium]